MKTILIALKDQRGMTGLETAIILIAFVTVAAVFSYAVLSAGLFSAERGKETIYSGLQEARSNLEMCGSVMATGTDSTNVSKIFFTVKNAIAGTPVDLTACDGTSTAGNNCVISLTTSKDYFNNVKWTKTAVGANDGDNLLEPGEMFEISVNLVDLGVAGPLSENLTANKTFSLQVKPAVGPSVTVQRTLPASISSVMDLDLGIGGKGGAGSGSSNGGSTPPPGTATLVCNFSEIIYNSPLVTSMYFNLTNTGSAAVDITGCTISVNSSATVTPVWGFSGLLAPGATDSLVLNLEGAPAVTLHPSDTFTVIAICDDGSQWVCTYTLPDGSDWITGGFNILWP
jgi:archaeal flagellin FlaB